MRRLDIPRTLHRALGLTPNPVYRKGTLRPSCNPSGRMLRRALRRRRRLGALDRDPAPCEAS